MTSRKASGRRSRSRAGRTLQLTIRGADAIQAFLTSQGFDGAFLSGGGRNAWLDTDRLVDPYRQEPRIFSCINLFADSAMLPPLRVYTKDPRVDPDGAKLVEGTALNKLLDEVNPLIDGPDLASEDATNMELSGESFWALTGEDGEPVRSYGLGGDAKIDTPADIWPVRGDVVEIEKDTTTGMVRAWRMPHTDGSQVPFPPACVVQHKYRNPRDPFRGMGPVAAAMGLAAQNYLALRYQNALLEGGGDMGGVLTVKGVMGDTTYKRLQAQVTERRRQIKPGDLLILDDLTADAEYTQTPVGQKVMSYQDLLKANRQWIAEIFRVPPALLGDMAENYATFKGHLRVFWTLKVLPWLAMREEKINRHLVKRLRDKKLAALFVRHDVSMVEALQGEVKEQAEAAEALIRVGVPPNAAVKQVGMRLKKPIDGGDVSLIGAGLVPLADLTMPEEPVAPEVPASPPAPPKPPDEKPPKEPAPAPAEEDDEDEGEEDRAAPAPTRATVSRDIYASSEARRVRSASTQRRRAKLEKPLLSKVRAYYMKQRKAQLRTLSSKAATGKPPEKAREPQPPIAPPSWCGRAQAAALARCKTDRELARWQARYPSTAARGGLDLDDLRDLAFELRAKVSKKELDELILARQQIWIDDLFRQTEAQLALTWDAEAIVAANEIGVPVIASGDPVALDFLKSKGVALAEGTNSTVAKRVKAALIKAIEENSTEGTLADRIRESLEECEAAVKRVYNATHSRAVAIARTEVAQVSGASTDAEFKKGKAEGQFKRHRWVTSGQGPASEGGTVRESHWDLDGQVFEIGKWIRTTNGNELRYANDMGCRGPSPASELVNCGCSMVPVEDDETE